MYDISIAEIYGSQLFMSQYAVAAIGPTISWVVSSRTGNFPLALLYAGMGAAVVPALESSVIAYAGKPLAKDREVRHADAE